MLRYPIQKIITKACIKQLYSCPPHPPAALFPSPPLLAEFQGFRSYIKALIHFELISVGKDKESSFILLDVNIQLFHYLLKRLSILHRLFLASLSGMY